MLERIPKELRELDQWVCATADKLPVNAINGFNASPTNSKTWSTFEKALANKKFPHIGFVLSEKDPYTIIDLDDPYDPKKKWTDEERESHAALNQNIINMFESYTEISQSGNGVHIIVKGSIPKGVNRDTVEMYSTQRYMICTGNIMKDLPIVNYQDALDNMYSQMKALSASVELEELGATEDDNDIISMAMGAANGAKFTELCNSVPDGIQNSEMDLALLSIIAFYSDSNEQCRRIFRLTERGKRDKVIKNDKYLDYTLQKIRANQPKPVDLEATKAMAQNMMKNMAAKRYAQDTNVSAEEMGITENDYEHLKVPQGAIILDEGYGNLTMMKQGKLKDTFSKTMQDRIARVDPVIVTAQLSAEDLFPDGLVGRVAKYIYESAPRPVPEIGLMASLGYLAGIVGQRYNVSGTGLNQYLILLAKTGVGKEGISSGIDRLNNQIRKQVPGVEQFRGPAAFASGPALVKMMSEKSTFLSILGEFGITLQQLCDPRANGAQVTLRAALLDLYQKSGKETILRASVYSDKEKNTDDVESPALSLLGESTPETFYEGLSEHHISDGLIPRFVILEYKGKRPYLNEENGFKPDDALIDDLVELVSAVLTMVANKQHIDVTFTNEAAVLSKAYEMRTTDVINGSANPVLCQLWNRSHLKLLKLAALIAVGNDIHNPVIDVKCFNWAQSFVESDIAAIMTRFEKGDVGSGEAKQYQDMVQLIKNYFVKKPHVDYKDYHDKGVIPNSKLTRGCANISSFKKDGRGVSRVREDLLRQLVDDGMLNQLPPAQAKSNFNTTAKLYSLGDSWRED